MDKLNPIEAEQYLNEATSGGIEKVIRDGPKEKIKQILELINRTITMLEDSLDILLAQESCSLKPPGSKQETIYGMTREVIEYKLSERMAEKFACEDALLAPVAQVLERIDPKLDHPFLGLDKEPISVDYSYLLKYLQGKKIDALENPLDNTITIFVKDPVRDLNLASTINSNIQAEAGLQVYTIQDYLYITCSIFSTLCYELRKLNLLPENIATININTPSSPYDYTYLLQFLKKHKGYEITETSNGNVIIRIYNLVADQSRLIKITIRAEKQIQFYDRGDQLELFTSKSSQLVFDLEREGLYVPMVVNKMYLLSNMFDKYDKDLKERRISTLPFNYDYLLRYLKEHTEYQIINFKTTSLFAIIFSNLIVHDMGALKLNTVTEPDVIFYHYGTLGLQLCFTHNSVLYHRIEEYKLPITVV
jgi:hypothetical protein